MLPGKKRVGSGEERPGRGGSQADTGHQTKSYEGQFRLNSTKNFGQSYLRAVWTRGEEAGVVSNSVQGVIC